VDSLFLLILLLLNTSIIFFIIGRNNSVVPYKINSPVVVSLYGVFLFYVFPVYYWIANIEDWPFNKPSYFEGFYEVQICIALFLIPIFFVSRKSNFNLRIDKVYFTPLKLSILYFIICLIIFNSYYETFILGNQGRFEFQSYESSSILYLLTSLMHDYGLCFILCLYLSTNKKVRKNALILLVVYFIPTLLSFHRFAILIYFFQLFVFFVSVRDFKIKPLKFILISVFGIIFVVGFIGRFGIEGIVYLSDHNGPISFVDILTITKNVIANFNFASEIRPSIWDEIFLRLNQSRSAAAVIHNYTLQSDFLLGYTFISVFFFFVPRYIYPDKPDMSSVHLITTEFMGEDFGGVNPLGSIAELFINFGYWGIIPISILFHSLYILYVKLIDKMKKSASLFVAFYPYFAFMFFAFDLNLSQRIVQITKGLLVYFVFYLILKPQKVDSKI